MARNKKNARRERRRSQSGFRKEKKTEVSSGIREFIGEFRGALYGPGIVGAGWTCVITTAFPWLYVLGICMLYSGLVVCIAESFWVPALRSRRSWQIVWVLFVIGVGLLFSFNVVLVKAPLGFDAYAMHHRDGERVADISWNRHLTDLRVWIMNSSKSDYKNLYINLQPDQWSYEARFLGNDQGCSLVPMKGDDLLVRPSGGRNPSRYIVHQHQFHFSADDNLGHEYAPLVRRGGYRVECSNLHSGDHLQIVFALAAPIGAVDAQSRLLPSPGSGKWGAVIGQVNGGEFRVLGPRPDSRIIQVSGHYSLGPKRFAINKKVEVVKGD